MLSQPNYKFGNKIKFHVVLVHTDYETQIWTFKGWNLQIYNLMILVCSVSQFTDYPGIGELTRPSPPAYLSSN